MNKQNIVLLVRNADYHDFGGAERYPVFLAQSLKKCNYDSVIVSRSPSLLQFAASHNLKSIRSWWWSRQNWSGYRALFVPIYILWQVVLYFWYLYVIISTKSSVLHIQSKDDFIAGTLAGKTLGKKVIWTDHADLKHIFKNLYVWYKNPIGKLVYVCGLLVDGLIIASINEKRLVSENLKDNSLLLKKMIIAYIGATDVKNKYDKKSHSKFTFGIATRLVTDKGISEAIEAFNMLNKLHADTKMLIMGDGPEAEKFKKQAGKNKDIVFRGHIADPLKEMNNLDVFLHPTYHESFSTSLVEASMLGLPIITTRVGGNPEIIKDNKTGLLVEARDVESLYRAMEKMYLDKKLRKELGYEARIQYVGKFNFDNIVKKQYVELYEK